mmetsp:Transcript_32925/g.61379  ORF Transcript_32925/g.61379 Transcript_32925/m.61379 type:complete len:239 (-) Transcript_32925:815-1531(-)
MCRHVGIIPQLQFKRNGCGFHIRDWEVCVLRREAEPRQLHFSKGFNALRVKRIETHDLHERIVLLHGSSSQCDFHLRALMRKNCQTLRPENEVFGIANDGNTIFSVVIQVWPSTPHHFERSAATLVQASASSMDPWLHVGLAQLRFQRLRSGVVATSGRVDEEVHNVLVRGKREVFGVSCLAEGASHRVLLCTSWGIGRSAVRKTTACSGWAIEARSAIQCNWCNGFCFSLMVVLQPD